MSQYAIMPISDYVSACSALREKTGGTDLIKSGEMSEKINEVYEKGKSDENLAFWEAIQDGGERTEYGSAFTNGHWTKETFKPYFDIKPTAAASAFFRLNNSPTNAEQIDFVNIAEEQGIVFDFSNCTQFNMCFATGGISRLGTIDVRASTGLTYIFYGVYNTQQGLRTIEKLICDEQNAFQTTSFQMCAFLETVNFEGVIGQNGLNLQWSTLLSHDSIVSIINALSTTTSGLSVTLSKTAVNNAFETETGVADGTVSAEWLALIATKSNWTISLI